jgi:hypothetical protein
MNLAILLTGQFWEGANDGGEGPPPTPTPTPAVTYGGGPFWKRYGYDDDFDDIREQKIADEATADTIRTKLAKKRTAQIEDAINAAAGAVERGAPAEEFLDQARAYQRVVKAQANLRKEFKDAITTRKAFRAEVARKLRLAEEARKIEEKRRVEAEEMDMLTVMFMDFED